MFKLFFNGIINLLATVIQIIVWPINTIIVNTLPDLTSKITLVTNGINQLFNGIGWALGLLPPTILATLVFIISVEIAKHTIYLSTHTLIKVWNILQKIKFW